MLKPKSYVSVLLAYLLKNNNDLLKCETLLYTGKKKLPTTDPPASLENINKNNKSTWTFPIIFLYNILSILSAARLSIAYSYILYIKKTHPST